MIERRRFPRQPASELQWVSASVRPGRTVSLVNVAEEGALVEARGRLLPGTRIVLQLAGPDGRLALRGRIVRCEVCALADDGIWYRGAVQFDDGLSSGNGDPLRDDGSSGPEAPVTRDA